MNKFIPLMAFAIFAVSAVGTQQAFAGGIANSQYDISDDATGGDCTGSPNDGPIPGAVWDDAENACMLNSDFEFGFESSMTVDEDVTLVNNEDLTMENTAELIVRGTFVNNGNLFADEPATFIDNTGTNTIFNFGFILIGSDTVLDNTNGELFNIGMITNRGLIINDDDTIENCGTIDSLGGVINPLGTINNYIGGTILGVSFNDINDVCPVGQEVVGGDLLPIDSTALMLAGLQSSAIWLAPVVISAVGIGLVLIRRK